MSSPSPPNVPTAVGVTATAIPPSVDSELLLNHSISNNNNSISDPISDSISNPSSNPSSDPSSSITLPQLSTYTYIPVPDLTVRDSINGTAASYLQPDVNVWVYSSSGKKVRERERKRARREKEKVKE